MGKMTGVWKEVDDFVRAQYIPIHMMLEVTRRCNLTCSHCYNLKDKAQLSLAQIDDILNQLREAGTLFLTLTGGEIFTRSDADDILRRARGYGFDIRIITNGTLITKDRAKVLADVNPLEVGVSVLGATAEVHDHISGVPGSFDRTITGIKNCIEQQVPVNIKCTLMNENYHQFNDIVQLAKDLGVKYLIDPIVTPRDDGDTVNLKHRLKDEFMKEFYMEHFMNASEEGDVEEKERGLPCEAGTGFGSISAHGDVYPCIQLPKKVGNVFEKRFKDIWQKAADLYKLRNVKKDEFRRCDHCSGSCQRCPGLSFLETGDPFGSSSIACLIDGFYEKYKAQQKGEQYQKKGPCAVGVSSPN